MDDEDDEVEVADEVLEVVEDEGGDEHPIFKRIIVHQEIFLQVIMINHVKR